MNLLLLRQKCRIRARRVRRGAREGYVTSSKDGWRVYWKPHRWIQRVMLESHADGARIFVMERHNPRFANIGR